MLMIPFVENAFKHGLYSNTSSFLTIQLAMNEGKFQFLVENSYHQDEKEFDREKGFGIGIENVKLRLDYIYPGKHKLSIAQTGDRFIVILDIQLDVTKGLGSRKH